MAPPILLLLAALRLAPKFMGSAYRVIWEPFVGKEIETPGTFLYAVYGKGSIGEPILALLKEEAFDSFEDFAAASIGLGVRGAGVRAGAGTLGSLTVAGLSAGLVKSVDDLIRIIPVLLEGIADPNRRPLIVGGILKEVLDQQRRGENLLRETVEAATALADLARNPDPNTAAKVGREVFTLLGGIAHFLQGVIDQVPPAGVKVREPTDAERATNEEEIRRMLRKANRGQIEAERKEGPVPETPSDLPPVVAPKTTTIGRGFTTRAVGVFRRFIANESQIRALARLFLRLS